jgi:serine/threonine protein kinase
VRDVVVADDTPWTVMRLVVRRSPQKLSRRSARCSSGEATRIGSALLFALAAAHAAGIVHRDVKPANVLLTNRTLSGTDGLPLIDVGIARAQDRDRTGCQQYVCRIGGVLSAQKRLRGNDGQSASDLSTMSADASTSSARPHIQPIPG